MVAIVIGSITALASRVLASSADWTLALQGHIAEIVILIGRAIRFPHGEDTANSRLVYWSKKCATLPQTIALHLMKLA